MNCNRKTLSAGNGFSLLVVRNKKRIMRILFAFVFFLFITGCEKEQEINTGCEELQSALVNADENKIEQAITEAISSLPSKLHTEQNLTALTLVLTNQCGVSAKVLCFRCIKTLPEQSEIRISATAGTGVVNKTIDISAISISDERMKFVNMHD
jgi:hypothetical protein